MILLLKVTILLLFRAIQNCWSEQASKKQYYIIAGAFSVEANANKLQSRLNKWNYNSTVIRSKNIMRVSYDEFKSKEEALISLAKIRKENPQAWILTI